MIPNFESVFVVSAAVLFAVGLLLATPVTVSFSIVRREAFTISVTIGWLFGLLRYTPSLAEERGQNGKRRSRRPAAVPRELDDSSREATRKTTRKASDTLSSRFRALLKSRGFVRGVLKFLRDMTNCVHFTSLRVAGRIGLDDPCDTGRLWGSICAVTGFLQGARRVRLLLEPEFSGSVFELDGQGEIRIVPVRLLLPTVRFVLSPTTLRAAWTAVRRPG